jgi:hypothetical protein
MTNFQPSFEVGPIYPQPHSDSYRPQAIHTGIDDGLQKRPIFESLQRIRKKSLQRREDVHDLLLT